MMISSQSTFEQWIHNRIASHTGRPSATRNDIQNYQLDKVNQYIAYVKANSPFYRDLLHDIPEIESLDDLQKLPFTNPHDLEHSPYKLLCVSLRGVARVFSHFTTGTMSGRPKKVFFTYKDADAIVDSMSIIIQTVMEAVGLEMTGRKVSIFLPNNGPPMSMAGLISRGVEKLGGVPVVGDCTAMTPEQIEQIEKEKPDMLMGSAFRIWRITQEARQTRDLAGIGVKAVFITSEYLSKAMRIRLEEYWQAEVFHHYGMTEPGFVIGVECSSHDGFHFDETRLLFEVIDPYTGKVVDDGHEGELVFTTLQREGMPLIRYRTGDVASLNRIPCACGASTLTRIGILPKRVGLIVEIGDGEKIYTSLFDEVLYQIPELIDYRIFITDTEGKDTLTCKVEMMGGLPDLHEGRLVESTSNSDESQNPELSTCHSRITSCHSRESGNPDAFSVIPAKAGIQVGGVEEWIPDQIQNDISHLSTELVDRILTIEPVRKSVECGLLARPNIEFVGRGVLRRGGRRMKRRIVDQRLTANSSITIE